MPKPLFDFRGKVALVTGAASGIGRATALAFAACGADLVLADQAQELGLQLREEIFASGGRALFRRTDIRRAEDCAALVEAACETFGGVDLAFNNAGVVGRPGRLAELEGQDWQRVIDVNLTGLFNSLKSELRAMQGRGGSIVNNASVMGLVGGAGAADYCGSKHGVIGVTRAVALEYARFGVRVNAICPGFVATPMTGPSGSFSEKSMDAAMARTALGRLATPEEIAATVLWLCSDGASYVVGTALVVDGGYTAA